MADDLRRYQRFRLHELCWLLDSVILQLIETKLGGTAVFLAITHGAYQRAIVGVDAHVHGVSVSHQVVPNNQAIGCVVSLSFQTTTVRRDLNFIKILV